MTDVVAARNVSQGFTVLSSGDGLPLLVWGKLWFAAHLHAARLCPRPALTGTGKDQSPLELSQAT